MFGKSQFSTQALCSRNVFWHICSNNYTNVKPDQFCIAVQYKSNNATWLFCNWKVRYKFWKQWRYSQLGVQEHLLNIMGGSNIENPVLQYLNIPKLSNSVHALKPQLFTIKGNMYLYFQFLLVSTQVYKMFLVFSLQTNLISIPCKTLNVIAYFKFKLSLSLFKRNWKLNK